MYCLEQIWQGENEVWWQFRWIGSNQHIVKCVFEYVRISLCVWFGQEVMARCAIWVGNKMFECEMWVGWYVLCVCVYMHDCVLTFDIVKGFWREFMMCMCVHSACERFWVGFHWGGGGGCTCACVHTRGLHGAWTAWRKEGWEWCNMLVLICYWTRADCCYANLLFIAIVGCPPSHPIPS